MMVAEGMPFGGLNKPRYIKAGYNGDNGELPVMKKFSLCGCAHAIQNTTILRGYVNTEFLLSRDYNYLVQKSPSPPYI